MTGRGLDGAIDVFFSALRDFTKRSADDVANVKRRLDEGYALGPQQFRERLKEFQRQCTAVEESLGELETRTVDATTLTELSAHCLRLYQDIVHGVDVVQAHLRNYGYEEGGCEKAPLDPTEVLRDPRKDGATAETTVPVRRQSIALRDGGASVARSRNVVTCFDYGEADSGAALEDTGASVKPARRSSQSGSTLSHDAFRCSLGTLALKQKYDSGADLPTSPAPSLPVSTTHDSFEFRPHQVQAELQEETHMEIDEEGKGETGFAEGSRFSAAPLQSLGEGQGTFLSPRLSYNRDQARFGSPFRSPHKKAEKSIFTTSLEEAPDPVISHEQYESLPQYLRGAVSHARLEAALPKLRDAFLSSEAFQSQTALEHPNCIGDKFLLQAFVKLNVLERHFHQGILGYRLMSMFENGPI